jgi:hypothetical protein
LKKEEEKAKRAKAIEEAKQRKNEQMLAQAAAPQTVKTAAVKATGVPSSSAASAAGGSAPSVAATGISTVKKAFGLVGGLINPSKKPANPVAAAPVASQVNTSNHGRAGSLSSNVRPVAPQPKPQTFDISVVSDIPSVAPSSSPAPQQQPVNVIPDEEDENVNGPEAVVVPESAAPAVNVIEPEPEPAEEPNENINPISAAPTAPIAHTATMAVVAPTVAPVTAPIAPAASPVKPTAVSVPLREVAMEQEEEEEEAKQYPMDDRLEFHIVNLFNVSYSALYYRDDSGTDDEEDDDAAREKKKSMVPEWAQTINLRDALLRQYGMVEGIPPVDPDSIFPEVNTCNLEEIFGCSGGRSGVYAHRSSSAKWDEDQISLVERRNYRSFLGFRPSIAPGMGPLGLGGSSPPKSTVNVGIVKSGSGHHMMSMPVNNNRPITSAISASASSQLR